MVTGVLKLHCLSVLSTLRLNFLYFLLDNLERFGSVLYPDPKAFENFSVLMEKSYRMDARRISTTKEETVQNMEKALRSVRRAKKGDEGTREERWKVTVLK